MVYKLKATFIKILVTFKRAKLFCKSKTRLIICFCHQNLKKTRLILFGPSSLSIAERCEVCPGTRFALSIQLSLVHTTLGCSDLIE